MKIQKSRTRPIRFFQTIGFQPIRTEGFVFIRWKPKRGVLKERSEIIELSERKFGITKVLDFSEFENQNKFLEGTGSLILDHKNKIAYASISSRTNEAVLDKWTKALGFEVTDFHSFDKQNIPIYHTNVMMCVGDNFAVICLESITDETERNEVIESLENSGKEIVEISFEQMENFAGNMLLLQNNSG